MTGLALYHGARAEKFFSQMLQLEILLLAADESVLAGVTKVMDGLGYALPEDSESRRQCLVALQVWATNYAQPVRLMLEFRNRLLHGAPTSDEEVEQVTTAGETAL